MKRKTSSHIPLSVWLSIPPGHRISPSDLVYRHVYSPPSGALRLVSPSCCSVHVAPAPSRSHPASCQCATVPIGYPSPAAGVGAQWSVYAQARQYGAVGRCRRLYPLRQKYYPYRCHRQH